MGEPPNDGSGAGGSDVSTGARGDTGGSGGSGGEVGSGGSGGDAQSSSASGGATGTGGSNGGSTNTGGAATTGSGGDTSTSGSGGSGGNETSSGGGTGGEPACLEPTTATGAVALTPFDGWVDCSTNTVGIDGAFFTYSDDGGSTIAPTTFEGAGDSICVSGVTAQVMDDDFDTYWGAGVGLNFNDESPWNADAVGVGGIQFSISDVPSSSLRVHIATSAGDHCIQITTPGTHIVRFQETSVDCWDGGGSTPNTTDIYRITWQAHAETESSYAFDFCLSNIAAVP